MILLLDWKVIPLIFSKIRCLLFLLSFLRKFKVIIVHRRLRWRVATRIIIHTRSPFVVKVPLFMTKELRVLLKELLRILRLLFALISWRVPLLWGPVR